MKPKSGLIRVVKTPDGDIVLDETGKQNGRGAYICKEGACASKIAKSRRMEKSFSMRIPSEIFDEVSKHSVKGESDINA
jgi:predicted RNA-binding protein YlxR (DUF448 family)